LGQLHKCGGLNQLTCSMFSLSNANDIKVLDLLSRERKKEQQIVM